MVSHSQSGSKEKRGHTLLELVAALTLLAVAIVPALRIMRDAISQNRRIEYLGLLTTLCVSKMEEHLAEASASWTETTSSGTFSSEGYSQIRFSVTRSDDAGSGGITDRLMAVTATVWYDEDADGVLDSGESSLVLASKIAKMERYEDEAGN